MAKIITRTIRTLEGTVLLTNIEKRAIIEERFQIPYTTDPVGYLKERRETGNEIVTAVVDAQAVDKVYAMPVEAFMEYGYVVCGNAAGNPDGIEE